MPRPLIVALLGLGVLASQVCAAQQGPPMTPPTAATPAKNDIVIPVEVGCGQALFVDVKVNGAGPFSFIIDSGGGSSYLIDRELAEKLNLEQGRRFRLSGAGENLADAYKTEGPELELAKGVKLKPETVVATSMHDISMRCKRPIAGLLGYDFFRHYAVELDYTDQRMVLHPTDFDYKGEGDRLPLRISRGNMMSVPAQVTLDSEQPVEVQMVIDTGDAKVPIAFTHDFADRMELLNRLQHDGEQGKEVGLGGHTSFIVAKLPGMELGNYRFRDLQVAVSQDENGGLAGGSYDGVLGGGVLSKFRLIFDLEHSQLILEPNYEKTAQAGGSN